MARTITHTKTNPARPFYAAVGGVDAAVSIARNGISDVQARLSKVDIEPKALADQGRALVLTRVEELQREAKTVPSRLEAKLNEIVADLKPSVDDLNKQYVELALRGRDLVTRIRRQQATQDLVAETKNTTTRAKTTSTQAKKAASTARSSAKATGTSATKAADAAKKAATDAAGKTGS